MPLKPLALFLVCVMAISARAEVSPVSMRVEQVSKNEIGKWKHTQTKSLKVLLSNSSQQDKPGLLVKYYFFGKGAGDHEAMLLHKGELRAGVKAHATTTVETPTVSRTYIEEHFEGSGGTGKKRRKPGKKIEESGEKIVGYGARIFEGDKMLAEFFSGPSYKELLGRR